MKSQDIIRGLSAVAIALTFTSAALANEENVYLAQADSVKAARAANAPLGVSAQGMQADRVVKINAKTKYVNVIRGTVVSIVNGDKTFTWKYDTLGTPRIELAKIAPADFGAGKVMVYVSDEIVSSD